MLFTCETVTDPEIREKLEKILRIQSMALGPLCLPNIHPKRGLESPPQFVAATQGTIVPMLSAPAMNCGMSVFITSLTKNDFSEKFLREFATKMRSGVTRRVGRFKTFLGWLGLSHRIQQPYDITPDELDDFFRRGAEAAIEKYNLPLGELEHIEYQGNVLTGNEKKSINLKQLVPRSSYTNARHEIGYNFGGNHFLEIHAVEKILDTEQARAWGIRENQLVLFYHGGGGHATYHLGRYFAHREKNTRMEKCVLFFLKCAFHFGSVEGIKNFRARWHAYFSRTPFPEITIESPEGKRLMQSIKIGLNYGYAFRTALLRRIIDAMPNGTHVSFLWDAAHNSITEEMIDGKRLIVHRQDAMHVFPGKPVMISGSNNTLSYIGIASESGQKTLWSVTPSAGKTIDTYVREGKSHTDPTHHATLVSKRKDAHFKQVEHVTSEGLFDIVRQFEKEDIIKPVVYLRPLGGLKGH